MPSDYLKQELELTHSILESSRILNLVFNDNLKHIYLSKADLTPLTENQFSILNILKIAGPLLVSEVANLMQLTRAAASKNIDKLVTQKLVARKIVAKDRRTVNVSLLKSGEIIVDKFEENRIKKQNVALNSLSSKERVQLRELLVKYVNQCLAQEDDLGQICLECRGSLVNRCILENHNIECRFRYS